MKQHFAKGLWLLAFTLLIGCGVYPGLLWLIGQTLFPFQANGSVVDGPDGKPVGSILIAQPFTKDEYFQPRPSACSFDATASSSSALAASNYALRGRVAQTLGPLVTYKGGKKAGQPVGPDIETWFQGDDKLPEHPGIVEKWADAHNGMAQSWVKADPKNAAYVDAWAKAHPAIVAQFVKDNPSTPTPQAADLAVVFFENFSKEHRGHFPSAVTKNGPDGKPVTTIEPVKEGTDIQSNFFDMWRQENPSVELQDVPADMVMTSGSGLDPHISMDNAKFQLDRVAGKWATNLKKDPAAVKKEIEQILQERAAAPLGGLAGEPYVNVLEVNLELRKKYGAPQ
jgi:K+-transporting ATPase ATPase C chain